LQDGKLFEVRVIGEDEALLLKATMDFEDEDKKLHKAGSIWMKRGPCEYIPPIEAIILETRKAFPLSLNEGIYVRNKETGEVKLIQHNSNKAA